MLIYPFSLFSSRLASRAGSGAFTSPRTEAAVSTIETATQAAHDVNGRTHRPMDTSGQSFQGPVLLTGDPADRPGSSIVGLPCRRRAGSGVVQEINAYRVADKRTGGGNAGAEWINTGRSMRDTCSPVPLTNSMPQTAPPVLIRAINGTDSSLPEGPPAMAQRRSQASQIVDLVLTVEKQALQLVTHPDSPRGVHTTPEEWAYLQSIRQLIGLVRAKEAGDELSAALIKNGPFSPRVRRLVREMYQHVDTGYFPDDDDEGMRR